MKTFKSFISENTFTNSSVRYMPGSGRGDRPSSHSWKNDDKYGWHVRDASGNVVYKSTHKDLYKAREDVKSKADELNKSLGGK
jgi:hypothetical protein